MFKLMAAASVAFSLLAPAPVDTWPAMGHDLRVALVASNGTGCPPGSTSVAVVAGGDGFAITSGAYVVPGGSSASCQLVVELKAPAGFTYAISSVSNLGYARLDPGAIGKLQMTSFFADVSSMLTATHTLQGPFDAAWEHTTSAEVPRWAPCDQDVLVVVNRVVRVDGPTTSMMTTASTDTNISTVFGFRWKACPASGPPHAI